MLTESTGSCGPCSRLTEPRPPAATSTRSPRRRGNLGEHRPFPGNLGSLSTSYGVAANYGSAPTRRHLSRAPRPSGRGARISGCAGLSCVRLWWPLLRSHHGCAPRPGSRSGALLCVSRRSFDGVVAQRLRVVVKERLALSVLVDDVPVVDEVEHDAHRDRSLLALPTRRRRRAALARASSRARPECMRWLSRRL